MKKFKSISALIALATIFSLASCKKDEPTPEPTPTPDPTKSYAYIVNYGSYSGAKAEISTYNITDKTITNNAYASANSVAFSSNIQYATINNNLLYCMSNNGDKIDIITASNLVQSTNPISTDIIKPRYMVVNGNTAYISCLGTPDANWSVMPDSYIAKFDLTTKSVTKIPLPGGPEGLAIANGKLYAALNYKDSIASINLSNDQVSYIATPAVSSYLLKDASENLYVTFVSTYSDQSAESGIGYINTANDSLVNNFKISGISETYGSIFQFNKDKSKIYVITASYDANWVLQGEIKVFNTTTKTFEAPFLQNISGINGIAVNPTNDDIYVLISPNTTANGTLKVYNSAGTLLDTKETGISPQQVLFLN